MAKHFISQATYTVPATSDGLVISAPIGATQIVIECWAGGNSGRPYTSPPALNGNGGYGGYYCKTTAGVSSASESFWLFLQTTSTNGAQAEVHRGTDGSGTLLCYAPERNATTGTPLFAAVGDVIHPGGNPGTGQPTCAGGGGGSGGPSNNGHDGVNCTGATAVSEGGTGGNGANGLTPAVAGGFPGGGGGGANSVNSAKIGGQGRIRISWYKEDRSVSGGATYNHPHIY